MAAEPQGTFLEHLSPSEQGRVLAALLDTHPQLRPSADQLAYAELCDVNPDAVAAEVVDIYLDQPFFEISNRVGRQPGRGYVDETEAQWELLEETLAPFVAEIARLARAGLHEVATRQALGIIAGLEMLRGSAGEETLIGWGELDQHVSELIEAVEYACRKSGVDVEVGQALVDQPAAG